MMSFKVNKIRLFFGPLFINILILLIYILSFEESNKFVLFVILLGLNWVYINEYLRKYLSKIFIDNISDTCTLSFTVQFFHREETSYPIHKLKCLFTTIAKARGVKTEVFRLFFNDLIILSIDVGSSGWSKNTCNQIKSLLDNPDNIRYSDNE